MFTLAPLDELIGLLADLPDPVSASLDPGEVNPPGAWIALDELRAAVLADGWEYRCSVYLVSPDTDTRRAWADHLGPLYDRLLAAVSPDGPVTVLGVVLPGDPTPLPALRVPVYLYNT